jgi:hypothetical protein
MLVLGLILIVVSALALIAALVGGSNDPATFDLGLFNVETNTLGVFLIGAATVLLFVMGLELTRSGVRRANRRRKEKKEYHRLADRYDRPDDRAESSAARTPTATPDSSNAEPSNAESSDEPTTRPGSDPR